MSGKGGESKLIVLSAGGTGGHMFPAAALARDLISRGYRVAWITDARGRRFDTIFGDIPVYVAQAGTLGAGIVGKARGVMRLATGLMQAGALIKKLQPAAVVGFGGYPSVPAVYMAQRRGIPTIIHEQNAVLGKANAFLAPRAARIALSLPYVQGIQQMDESKTVLTGNPVRAEIAVLCTKPYPVLETDGVMRLFVVGGSLGATVFSEVVPEALARLPAAARARLDVTQQCRAEDIDAARARYERAGIKARLETFYTDIPAILEASHLVISRSGASTVAEVTAAGRPAIFVPAPYHGDNQQKINADSVADVGGGWVMMQDSFTPEALATRLETLMRKPETLFRAAEAARACGKPDAARRLGNLVMALVSGWEKAA